MGSTYICGRLAPVHLSWVMKPDVTWQFLLVSGLTLFLPWILSLAEMFAFMRWIVWRGIFWPSSLAVILNVRFDGDKFWLLQWRHTRTSRIAKRALWEMATRFAPAHQPALQRHYQNGLHLWRANSTPQLFRVHCLPKECCWMFLEGCRFWWRS